MRTGSVAQATGYRAAHTPLQQLQQRVVIQPITWPAGMDCCQGNQEDKGAAQVMECADDEDCPQPQADIDTQHNRLSMSVSNQHLREQRCRGALREFQRWLLNARLHATRCSDTPQTSQQAAHTLQQIQELLDAGELAQVRLNDLLNVGDHLSAEWADGAAGIRKKANRAVEDWHTLRTDLQKRQTSLKNLQSKMRDFEARARPLRDWMRATEVRVQQSTVAASLHDVQSKRQQLNKLQAVLKEGGRREAGFRQLRDVVTGGSAFTYEGHRLGAQYQALSDLTKERLCRMQRVCEEHQVFSEGLEDLQRWLSEAKETLQLCSTPSSDTHTLRSRMDTLEELLCVREVKEQELKVLLARGECVYRNTSPEGATALRKRTHKLKDAWDTLLTSCNTCKSSLEVALVGVSSVSEGVRLFQRWLQRIEETLESRTHTLDTEMRDKTTSLRRAKLLYEDVLRLSGTLDTIISKDCGRSDSSTPSNTYDGPDPTCPANLQPFMDRYTNLKHKAKAAVECAEERVYVHQEYQRALHQFEEWMEAQQEKLDRLLNTTSSSGGLSHLLTSSEDQDHLLTSSGDQKEKLDHLLVTSSLGDLQHLENGLQELQVLRCACSEGSVLLSAALCSRERVLGGSAVGAGSPEVEPSSGRRGQWTSPTESTDVKGGGSAAVGPSLVEGGTIVGSSVVEGSTAVLRGCPVLEERVLCSLRAQWSRYQSQLSGLWEELEGKAGRLRTLDLRLIGLEEWLTQMEAVMDSTKKQHGRSDLHTKQLQLQTLQRRQAEALRYQGDMDSLVVMEIHSNKELRGRTTQIQTSYLTLLNTLTESIKLLECDINTIEEFHSASARFSDWLKTAQRNFLSISSSNEDADLVPMEERLKSLEAFHEEVRKGGSDLLSQLRWRGERAAALLLSSSGGVERLEGEVEEALAQHEELLRGLREERASLERRVQLHREVGEEVQALMAFLEEARRELKGGVKRMEELRGLKHTTQLLHRKAKLSRYKATQNALRCRAAVIAAVVDKGRGLTNPSPSLTHRLEKLQDQFTHLCSTADARVDSVCVEVCEQECYLKELRQVERWLMQTASRMLMLQDANDLQMTSDDLNVTSDDLPGDPDPAKGPSLQLAIQQLARHKTIMEEVAGFEERLSGLRGRGQVLLRACGGAESLKQEVQHQLQGATDSYSAICSTAHRVYQSLDGDLQRRVCGQDILLVCQSWISHTHTQLHSAEHTHTPHRLQEALSQLADAKALQEEAATYLQLLCSSCDLSDEAVRETATHIQRIRIQVEQRVEGAGHEVQWWEEFVERREQLANQVLDLKLCLRELSQRPAHLELPSAQNTLEEIQALIEETRQHHDEAHRLQEELQELRGSQETVEEEEMMEEEEKEEKEVMEEQKEVYQEQKEVRRLREASGELERRTRQLQQERQEEAERGAELQQVITSSQEIMQRLSREEDHLARVEMESSAEHLSALRKLQRDLQEQREEQEDLFESRREVMPRLAKEERGLLQDQAGRVEERWSQEEQHLQMRISSCEALLRSMEEVETRLQHALKLPLDNTTLQRPALDNITLQQPSLENTTGKCHHDVCPEMTDMCEENFLLQQLSVCAEMEARREVLEEVMGEAEELMGRLGLQEKRRLQRLLEKAQKEAQDLGVTAANGRKLMKSYTEHAHILRELGRVEQAAKKAMTTAFKMAATASKMATCCSNSSDFTSSGASTTLNSFGAGLQNKGEGPLLASRVSRQLKVCINTLSSLGGQQSELRELWQRARELEGALNTHMTLSTNDTSHTIHAIQPSPKPTHSILERLQQVETTLATYVHSHTLHLQRFQKALIGRRHLQQDINKLCDWLKQAEELTFAQVAWSASEEHLGLILKDLARLQEQGAGYESLLMMVMRAGGEVLEELGEERRRQEEEERRRQQKEEEDEVKAEDDTRVRGKKKRRAKQEDAKVSLREQSRAGGEVLASVGEEVRRVGEKEESRTGEEVLASLEEEQERSYLEELLHTLPERYSRVLVTAKQRQQEVHQVLEEKRRKPKETQKTDLQQEQQESRLEKKRPHISEQLEEAQQELSHVRKKKKKKKKNPCTDITAGLHGDGVTTGLPGDGDNIMATRDDIISRLQQVERSFADFTTASASSDKEADSKLLKHKALVVSLGSLKGSVEELRGGSCHGDAESLWQRWTCLHNAARRQQRALQHTAQQWSNLNSKVERACKLFKELQSVVVEAVIPGTSCGAALESLLQYQHHFCSLLHTHTASLEILRYMANDLMPPLQAPVDPQSAAQEDHVHIISSLLERCNRLLEQVCVSGAQVQRELQERRSVCEELRLVWSFVRDTHTLTLSPNADLDTLIIDLEAAREEVCVQKRRVESVCGHQQLKYETLQTHTPKELHTLLSHSALALDAAEKQVSMHEEEVVCVREMREECVCRSQLLLQEFRSLDTRLQNSSNTHTLEEAQVEHQRVCEDLERCSRTLEELRVCVKEMGGAEQNKTLLLQLRHTLTRLDNAHTHTAALAEDRSTHLIKAEQLMQEFRHSCRQIENWAQEAESVAASNITCSQSEKLQRNIHTYQSVLRRGVELCVCVGVLDGSVCELSGVLDTTRLRQQRAALRQRLHQLQHTLTHTLHDMKEAAQDVSQLEKHVKVLRVRLEETQGALTCPELARASLRQQLAHRQVLLREMGEVLEECEELQRSVCVLRLPEQQEECVCSEECLCEEVCVSASPLCNNTHSLQGETRRLTHSLIQQCNILQEAVLQQEQYEQEVMSLQRLVDDAQRLIHHQQVTPGNAQTSNHEELSRRIAGYQREIWALSSRSKMLGVKAKHTSMMLALREEVQGLEEEVMEEHREEAIEEEMEEEEEEEEEEEMTRHPSVVMMTAGRCHTLLSPVTEESGEEGTNSEVSSPPACRSPSPTDQGSSKASRAPPSEASDPESSITHTHSHTHLDGLQRSWDTIKNVMRYQETLQCVSAKMEAMEAELNQPLDQSRSPQSQMASHQALLDELLLLQEEMLELQECLSEDLHGDAPEGAEQQQAVQSTLTVLAERLATIRMKASGKRQLLEERLSEQLEEQRQEQALQRCHTEAEELDHWLLSTRQSLSSALQPRPQEIDMEEQLIDCQDMLVEIERKVWCLSELSVHSENLFMEGRGQTRGEAGLLSTRLQGLKASLLDLQRILQDKLHQGSLLQQQEDSGLSDSSLSQSPALHDWLSQSASSRGQQQHHMQRHREQEGDLSEQKKLLQSVANRGEELLTQKTTPTRNRQPEEQKSPLANQSGTALSQEQLLIRCKALRIDMRTKLQLSLDASSKHTPVCVYSRVSCPGSGFRRELTAPDCPSPKTLLKTASQSLKEKEVGGARCVGQLCAAVRAASFWCDAAETRVLTGPMLHTHDTEMQLYQLEALAREVCEVDEEVRACRQVLRGGDAGGGEGGEAEDMEETLMASGGPMEEEVKDGDAKVTEKTANGDGLTDERMKGGERLMTETQDGIAKLKEGDASLMEQTLRAGEETGRGGSRRSEEVKEGGTEEEEVMEEVLDVLHQRLELLSNSITPRSQQLTHTLQQCSTLQEELQQLSSALSESRKQLQQKLIGLLDSPAPRQAESVAEAEECVREFEARVEEMRSRADALQPDQTTTQELHRVQECYEELLCVVGCVRGRACVGEGMRCVCERLLGDLRELMDTAQDKMAAEMKLNANTVTDVHTLLDTHKEFFGVVEQHVYLTEAWLGAWSGQLRNVGSQWQLERNAGSQSDLAAHWEAISHAHNILKQAHKRGMELETILEAWTGVSKDYEEVCATLEKVESSIPTAALVEETQERITHRINLYQRLKSTLSGRQQQLYSVLENGKRLLLSVCCCDLETQLNQLGERWLHTHTRLNKEIQRLDATLTHWSRYERESADLSQWLRSALERLDFWNTQSVTVPQELELVRDHLHAFLEFSKDVDAHSEQQRAVMSLGAQVLRLKRVDTATLRSHMTEMDTQWSTLNTRIPHVQEKLHQLQMDKLSSCEAVAEVMSWISVMENSIQQEQQSIMGAVGSEAVRHFLNKYKGLRLELSCKQLTVDCVNGSVLQVSSLDVETKRSSRTHFAERLGTMNRHWSLLNTLVTEKIQVLESLLEKWEEHETGVSTLGAWLSNQEEKLNSRQRLEDITSVQNALKDTQELEVCMRDRSAELSRLEDSANQLMKDKSPDASTAVMETLTGLKQTWASLEKMVSDVKTELKRVCETWGVYRRVCEDIGGYLIEGRYSIARLRQLTCSPHATHAQVESLEALQRELETQEGSLAKLGSTTHTLLELAHPSVAHTLTHTLSDLTLRWNNLLEHVSDQLKSARALLLLWERYDETLTHTQTAVTHHEKDAHTLLRNSSHTHNVTGEEVLEWIHTCNELLASQEGVQERLQELQEAANQLQAHTLVPPIAMTMHHAHFLSLSQRLATSQAALSKQLRELQGVCEEVHEWEEQLDSLTETLDETLNTHTQQSMEDVKAHISVLIGRSPDLERLNERSYTLALSDTHTHTPRLQSLNRRWNTHSAHTLETYSALQGVCAQQQSFREKCESWMELLDSAERQLTPSISASYANLVEEQKQHEMFQAEVFSKQQILFSIICDGHSLLYHVQDREDFIQQMAQLSHEWQAVVHRCQRRRGLVEGLLWQWDRYRHLLETTRRYLDNASPVPLPCYPDNASSASAPALSEQQVEPIALQQARVMLHHIQVCERSLKRQQGGYILAMEAGRQLLHWEGPNGEETLLNDVGAELAELQEQWRSVTLALDARKRQLHALLKEWERCERAIAASQERLCVLKRKLALPLPEHHDELHTEQIHCKELEASVSERECVLQVCELKETLSSKLRPHDLIVLSERIDLLNSQWEEVSHQVCVRRAQVCERLNEWAVFNEKSKELCDWLTQMEAKVSQNADISIQDMIDKLRKEYNEEMCVAEENRHQLQEMGERLASASQPSKANEIQYKLNKMAERWQHLVDLIAARVKKLKETLLAVQQLDKNMSSLRSWLAHIETELSRPIIYQRCDPQEIQHKLEEQQELQRDIEKHSAGVASVLCVCEVLLHDCDACASESECDSIQNATRHLDRRWRNICAIAMERRLKIEETGRLWNKFLDDFGRFEEWLKASERTAARPNSSNIIYTLAKEELKKFEAFQRQVQECLTQLELINKQYRRLARENRTDATGRLKDTVHDGNRRWDALQRRVAAILRRLRHFIAQREEFESNRDSMLVWLTEMDLQLTNIEHFSECDTHAKIKQLRAFQQEMCLNAGRLSSVFHQGEALLCRCEPLDAAVIEEELEELRRYCMEVFGRVERYYRRLTRLPEYEDDLDESSELADLQLDESSHTLRTPQRPSDRDRDTPLSIDSLPLEWDHDFDLEPCGNISPAPAGGSTMRRNITSTPPGGSIHPSQLDVVIPDSPEGYIRLTHDTLMSSSGDLGHQDTEQYLLQQTGGAAARMDSSTPEPDSPYMGYMRLMGDGRGSSEPMRTRDEEEEEDEALSTDTAGVVRVQSREQPWQQLSSELESLEAWLSGGEEGLNQLRKRGLGTGVNALQHSSKKLRELQEGMDSHRPKLLSINLRAVGLLQSGAEDEQQEEEVKRRLQGVTRRFEEFSCSLEEFRRRTQAAIMQCQEFHESSHALLLWLEEMDYRRKQVGPISPRMDTHTLNTHIHTLTDVLDELKEGQQRVDQLQELSNTLLQEERRAGRGGGQEDMMRGAGGGVEEVMRRGARGVEEEEEEEEMRRAGRGGEESREGRGEEERQRGAHTQEKRVQERRKEAHWREEEEEEREREEQEEEEVREREEARERVHVISSRLRTLMREVTSDLKLLHSILTQQPQAKSISTPPPGLPATHPRSTSSSPLGGSTGRAAGGCVDSSAPLGGSAVASARSISSGPLCGSTSTAGRSTSSRPEGVSSAAPGGRCGDSFFLRVLRAALPLQLLLLLLLALVCLVPFSHEDYSCHHANNFKRSFHPMLRYTNGPPPI